MTKDQRTRLELRLVEINWALADIANLRVVKQDDPATAEDALLRQRAEIEGRLRFERRES